ncbi:hypothetical protein D1872_291630 [compost metagenome]
MVIHNGISESDKSYIQHAHPSCFSRYGTHDTINFTDAEWLTEKLAVPYTESLHPSEFMKFNFMKWSVSNYGESIQILKGTGVCDLLKWMSVYCGGAASR